MLVEICDFDRYYYFRPHTMEQSISNAFLLLIIGMITVFIVLLLVVGTGRLLINLVNRISYEKLDALSTGKVIAIPNESVKSGSIKQNKLAAIIATVEIVSQGKGKITKIEKIN